MKDNDAMSIRMQRNNFFLEIPTFLDIFFTLNPEKIVVFVRFESFYPFFRSFCSVTYTILGFISPHFESSGTMPSVTSSSRILHRCA